MRRKIIVLAFSSAMLASASVATATQYVERGLAAVRPAPQPCVSGVGIGPLETSVPAHDKAAVRWIRAAANAGDRDAIYDLSRMHENGYGVEMNDDRATFLLFAAADSGSETAQERSGHFCALRIGFDAYYQQKAVRELRRIERGYGPALFAKAVVMLADFPAFQQLRPKDDPLCPTMAWTYRSPSIIDQANEFKLAEATLVDAAETEYPPAQYLLGLVYLDGLGSAGKQIEKGIDLMRRAAKQGHIDAQNKLGILLADGHGLPQNYVLAHMYFNLAAATPSHEEAYRNRKKIERPMTKNQVAEAQKLARECHASEYKGCEPAPTPG